MVLYLKKKKGENKFDRLLIKYWLEINLVKYER